MQPDFIQPINRQRSFPRPPLSVGAGSRNLPAKPDLQATLRCSEPPENDLRRCVSTELSQLGPPAVRSWQAFFPLPAEQNS